MVGRGEEDEERCPRRKRPERMERIYSLEVSSAQKKLGKSIASKQRFYNDSMLLKGRIEGNVR